MVPVVAPYSSGMARSSWTHVTGKVVAAAVDKIYGGSGQGGTATRWKYVVELEGDDHRRVELKQEWGLFRQKMINPVEGSRVPLLLDPASGDVRFDVDDPAINWKAQSKADEERRARDFEQKKRS
jgi:hypothetical protein